MTGEIVNLRKARKARDRAAREARAAENRIVFGRTRAEREMLEARNQRDTRLLDGHRLTEAEPPDSPAAPPVPAPDKDRR